MQKIIYINLTLSNKALRLINKTNLELFTYKNRIAKSILLQNLTKAYKNSNFFELEYFYIV